MGFFLFCECLLFFDWFVLDDICWYVNVRIDLVLGFIFECLLSLFFKDIF